MSRCLLLILVCTVSFAQAEKAPRTFIINGSQFSRDGEAYQIVSGSMHYFRHHPSTYAQRLSMARLCGLNAVQTYISWTVHEPQPGNYQRLEEITMFLAEAQKQQLLVILRPGPYICAETEGGGLPGWLQANGPAPYGFVPRSGDPRFLSFVDAWFAVLLPLLRPFLYSNGGPVILSQVSNEDGFWSGEPGPYLHHIFNAYVDAWGQDAVIIHSTDSVNSSLLASTHIPGQYQTVDFGPGPAGSAEAAFAIQAAANGNVGPPMNSEYYVIGVNRNWGDQPYVNDTEAKINSSAAFLRGMLAAGASINMYMFSGGTNWGFEAGLHADGPADFQTGPYIPTGPVTEAGDASQAFGAVCAVVSEARGLPAPSVPPPAPKSHYMGQLAMTEFASLWDALPLLLSASNSSHYREEWSIWPPTLESLLFDRGYMIYESAPTAEAVASDGSNLYIRDVRDRAYVFVNNTSGGGSISRAGVFQRNLSNAWAPSPFIPVTMPSPRHPTPDNRILVLVENEGRVCFGPHLGADPKGLPSGLQLGTWANPYLFNWTSAVLPMTNVTGAALGPALQPIPQTGFNASWSTPTFYRATFSLSSYESPLRDTFLDMRGWGKGFVVLNGFNLGRYWYLGPEFSLYVPAGVLLQDMNELLVFEADGLGAGCGAGARGEEPASSRHSLGGCPEQLPFVAGASSPYITFREVPCARCKTTQVSKATKAHDSTQESWVESWGKVDPVTSQGSPVTRGEPSSHSGKMSVNKGRRMERDAERPFTLTSKCQLPTQHGTFEMRVYTDPDYATDIVAMVARVMHGAPHLRPAPLSPVLAAAPSHILLRVHDQCATSEVFGSLKCDCRQQLDASLESMQAAAAAAFAAWQLASGADRVHDSDVTGVLVYLPQEGRGIGLGAKVAAYALQEEASLLDGPSHQSDAVSSDGAQRRGLDTVDANRALGLPDDSRHYEAVPRVLADIGILVRSSQTATAIASSVTQQLGTEQPPWALTPHACPLALLTNSPRKAEMLAALGIPVDVRRACLVQVSSPHAGAYLRAKAERMGHDIPRQFYEQSILQPAPSVTLLAKVSGASCPDPVGLPDDSRH